MRILLFMLIPLVFFGAGVLFASLVWGKYKQLCAALRDRVDRHIENEEKLQTALDELREEHTDQATTCRTLEEELAYFATERESLLAELEKATVNESQLNILKREIAESKANYQNLNSEIDTLRRRSESGVEAAKAAENRARLLEDEKAELLGLVSKLQAKLEQLDKMREKGEREAQTRSLRLERQRRRRATFRAKAAESAERRRRVHRRQASLRPSEASPSLTPEASPTIETAKSESHTAKPPVLPDNGQPSPSVAKMLFSAAAERLFASNAPKEPAEDERPQKRRERW